LPYTQHAFAIFQAVECRFLRHEVKEVDHYWLSVDALTQPMQVREPEPPRMEVRRRDEVVQKLVPYEGAFRMERPFLLLPRFGDVKGLALWQHG
jgi:hypothetical protein